MEGCITVSSTHITLDTSFISMVMLQAAIAPDHTFRDPSLHFVPAMGYPSKFLIWNLDDQEVCVCVYIYIYKDKKQLETFLIQIGSAIPCHWVHLSGPKKV